MGTVKKLIRNYIAEHPNCNFIDIATEAGLPKATTCGEIWAVLDELSELKDGWDAILVEGTPAHNTFRLKPGSNCYVEAVQDITIQCYQKMYDRMEEPDHVQLLQDLRALAQEFEDWWWNLPESERDERGYWESIEAFAEKRLHEEEYTRDTNLQEFTASAVNHAVGAYDHMSNVLNMSRPQAFLEIQKWADEFWDQYKDHKYTGEESYYDLVDKFLLKKMSQMKEA